MKTALTVLAQASDEQAMEAVAAIEAIAAIASKARSEIEALQQQVQRNLARVRLATATHATERVRSA